MERFNLEDYLKDPSRKVITRGGLEARIICTDRDSLFPVIFLVRKEAGATESVFAANENGICSIGVELCDYDLFFTTKKQSRWMYLFECEDGELCTSMPYETRESAEAVIQSLEKDGLRLCVKVLTEITWEE